MNIEHGTQHDYEEIIKVWEASVRATHAFVPEEYIQELRALILNSALPAVDVYLIKDQADNIMGFMGISGEMLEMLFIAPEHFRKGLGKALTTYAVDTCGVTKVDVNEQNPEAHKFYLAQGFKVTRRSPTDGMGKPYPILHMERCR
ncbi:putative acetyltransferase [Desulfobaculum xiamenense]|uniref:Putative acetyltransferase n=1 Tax=Desulfobaculum xiamenense TaxID=995050 RepID=A0A846QK32_9BACT|nr:GNAT family N-acetyltransferase [Desulfobaculum xiamenense]NJB66842.1 putative acetyltransferase [Desulfobaculum xiamenense]